MHCRSAAMTASRGTWIILSNHVKAIKFNLAYFPNVSNQQVICHASTVHITTTIKVVNHFCQGTQSLPLSRSSPITAIIKIYLSLPIPYHCHHKEAHHHNYHRALLVHALRHCVPFDCVSRIHINNITITIKIYMTNDTIISKQKVLLIVCICVNKL